MGIVEGDKAVIEYAEQLQKYLLDPVECVEKALDGMWLFEMFTCLIVTLSQKSMILRTDW